MQTPIFTLRIESWPIERLLPYVRNARTHSAVQIRQIAASIAEFGFNNPVLIDAEGSIIAGELKLPQVPVIVLAHLTESQKRAFRIADNQVKRHKNDTISGKGQTQPSTATLNHMQFGFTHGALESRSIRHSEDRRRDPATTGRIIDPDHGITFQLRQ